MPSNYNRRRYYTPSLSTQLRNSYDNSRHISERLTITINELNEWKNLCQMFFIQLEAALIAAGQRVDDNEVIKRYRELVGNEPAEKQ